MYRGVYSTSHSSVYLGIHTQVESYIPSTPIFLFRNGKFFIYLNILCRISIREPKGHSKKSDGKNKYNKWMKKKNYHDVRVVYIVYELSIR